jgi:hypothetical protein
MVNKMTDCIIITKFTVLIICIIWILLSAILLWKYQWQSVDSDLSLVDWAAVLFVTIGICILLVLICFAIAWFIFSYLPTILPCIKVV